MITDSSYETPCALIDLFLWICCNRLFSRSPSYRLSEPHIQDCLATPVSFALNYWWTFSPYQLQGQIDWHVSGGVRRIDHPYAEARRTYNSIKQTLPACYVCSRHGTKISCPTGTLAEVILTSSVGEGGQADWPRVNPTQGYSIHSTTRNREIYKGQEVYEQYKNVVPNICTAQAMSCTITKLFCLTSMACHPLVVYSDLTGMGCCWCNRK